MTAIRYDANKQGININYRIRSGDKFFWLIASQIILARSPNNNVFGSLSSMKSHSQFIFTDRIMTFREIIALTSAIGRFWQWYSFETIVHIVCSAFAELTLLVDVKVRQCKGRGEFELTMWL